MPAHATRLDQHYGPARFRRVCRELLDYGERRMAVAIAALPDGTYRFADHVEGIGRLHPVKVTVTIDGAGLHADFAGSDDQVAANFNAVEAVTSRRSTSGAGGHRSHHPGERWLLPDNQPGGATRVHRGRPASAPGRDGMSGVHTGMTNTKNTPIEPAPALSPAGGGVPATDCRT
jgi:N-methylhydantoinase B/oxoprolinase/acetone carboxylase alpha subunit